MDVWIIAADNMASGHVYDILALVGEEALDGFTKNTNGGPASEQDGIL